MTNEDRHGSGERVRFEWTPSMTVGQAAIDAQHQRLLAQLNKVMDAMIYGVTSEEVASAVTFFKEYVDEHLAYEETYMARRGYKEIEAHEKKHQEFRDTYQTFHDKLVSGTAPADLLMEMEVYLGDWWTGHILHEDKKYYLELGPATS
jgi:hemerythrin-like metal-binding protein